MQIAKWGNSLAVRLPAKLVEQLGLKEGDEVELRPAAAGTFDVARRPTADELFDRIKKFRGRLPADYKFDREEANSRGADDAE
jgi:antitoxin MazE